MWERKRGSGEPVYGRSLAWRLVGEVVAQVKVALAVLLPGRRLDAGLYAVPATRLRLRGRCRGQCGRSAAIAHAGDYYMIAIFGSAVYQVSCVYQYGELFGRAFLLHHRLGALAFEPLSRLIRRTP
jgi:hypothetical protein